MIGRLIAGLVFLAACACADAPGAIEESAVAVTNGSSTWTAAVVLLLPATDEVPLCSGTVVAPQLVLTAAHCASAWVEAGALDSLAVVFGADMADALSVLGASDAVVHPGYDPGSRADDVAVLQLDDRAPAAPIELADEPAAIGDGVEIVGFGADQPGGSAGTQRSGAALVDDIDAGTLLLTGSPSLSCAGDSGGPVLRDGAIVAVIRSGDPSCSEFGMATGVEAARELLDEPDDLAGGCAAGAAAAGGDPRGAVALAVAVLLAALRPAGRPQIRRRKSPPMSRPSVPSRTTDGVQRDHIAPLSSSLWRAFLSALIRRALAL